ncbi:Ig-like domain-containing protein [Arthrobacter sp. Z4-13]
MIRKLQYAAGTGQVDPPPRRLGARAGLASAAAGALLAAALSPLAAAPAIASTAGVGPVDPSNGFPSWFSDGTVRLQLCYMADAGCLSEPPNIGAPASYPDNFPEEAFWFAAEAAGGNLGLYEAALEGAHTNGVVEPGEQMGFGRLRFIVENILPNASYTITHPYGVNVFTSEADPKNPALGRIRVTLDSGVCAPSPTVPCDWAGVGAAFLGDYKAGSTATFLRQVGAAPGTLGDINTPRAVTGAPSGTNAVIIDGPNAGGPGINTLTVSTFTVQGLIAEGSDGAPSTPDLAAVSDSGHSATDNITNIATPTMTGTAPAGSPAPVQLIVDGAATPVATTLSGGSYSARLAPLAPGIHKIQSRTANPAYLPDPATGLVPADVPQYLTSPTLTFTVDTAAPAASVTAPFPSTPTLDNTPTLNFSSEAGAKFECRLLPSNSTWDPTCASPKTWDAQVNGTHVFEVRAKDAAGNVSAIASRTVRIGAADTVAPTVASRAPASGATGVGTGTNITATFSEFVQGISGTTLTLKNAAGTTIPATVTYDQATRRATLDPTALLTPNTTYTATLTGGTAAIRDLANRPLASTSWRFTTSTAPTVTSRTPGVNATGVLRTANITATFSKPVNGVSATTFTLKNTATGAAVTATVTRNGTTNQWILNPATTLAASTRYTATITGGPGTIRDVAGTPLATTSWSFTTGTS